MSSADLLRRIEEFAVDGPGPVARPFAARLARENGWPRAFAGRVVREYKRFAYLTVTAGHPVCPSDEVDQAWHLHLTYTRSYWGRFCGEVLGRPLHHDPSPGGPDAEDRHRRMYADTLAAYRREFGHEPPADVWPPAAVRFAPETHARVDRAANWVVPKAVTRRAAPAVGAAIVVVVFATGCGDGMNPFALQGTQFLAVLIPVMAAALAAGLCLRWVLRGPAADPGDDPPELNWREAAYLAGGADRLFSAAVAKLYRDGALETSADGKSLVRTGPAPAKVSAVEAAVLAAAPLHKTNPADLKRVREAVADRAAGTAERLTADGLLLGPARAWTATAASAAPLGLVLVLLGLPRLCAGLVNDRPVAFLVAALLVGWIVFMLTLCVRPERTRRGDAAVDRLRRAHALDKHAKTRATDADLPLAVALFGTAALAGSALAPLHQWYPRQTDGGTSGACGTGCGTGCGGGGGGGGCGGCGGGD